MNALHRVAAAAAAAAVLGLGAATSASAAQPSAAPGAAPAAIKDRCTHNSSYTLWGNVVSSVDWLRVHSSPSTSSGTVGQLPGGAQLCAIPGSHKKAGGYDWYKLYGFNGSTKVTGWGVHQYIDFPAW